MIINAKDGRQIYHTHIPRTGGRYLRDLFLNNEYVLDLGYFKSKKMFYDYEVPHLSYPLNEIYLAINGYNHSMPKFCVIRHPITRLKSMMRIAVGHHGMSYNEVTSMEDFVRLTEQLKSVLSKEFKDWLVPQTEFIGDCEVWKYEDGLGSEFCQWIEDTFDFEMLIKEPKVFAGGVSSTVLEQDFQHLTVYGERFDEYATMYFENEIKILGYEKT